MVLGEILENEMYLPAGDQALINILGTDVRCDGGKIFLLRINIRAVGSRLTVFGLLFLIRELSPIQGDLSSVLQTKDHTF